MLISTSLRARRDCGIPGPSRGSFEDSHPSFRPQRGAGGGGVRVDVQCQVDTALI